MSYSPIKASDIVRGVRYVVADKDENVWTDDTILEGLNHALQRLYRRSNQFREAGYIPLYNRVNTYSFVSFAFQVLKVRYQGTPLAPTEVTRLDKGGGKWWEKVGNAPSNVIFNYFSPSDFIIYPMVDSTATPTVKRSSEYGIIVAIENTGVKFELEEGEQDSGQWLGVYYIKRPVRVTTVDDALDDYIRDYYDVLVFDICSSLMRQSTNNENNRRFREFLESHEHAYRMLEESKSIAKTEAIASLISNPLK